MLLIWCAMIVSCAEIDDPDLSPPVLILPVDGDTVQNNPPLFVWRSVDDQGCDLLFWIEIADDAIFSYDSIILSTLIPIADTFFDPIDSFTTGTYYWHICVFEQA